MFDIRPDLPLGDRTVWEMMLILQNQGWEWRQMPKNRAGLVHSPASPLIWYTSGNTAHRWYLQALLSSRELFAAGLGCIPHGKYPSANKTLLSGGRLQQRRRATVLAAIEEDVAPAAAAAQAHRTTKRTP